MQNRWPGIASAGSSVVAFARSVDETRRGRAATTSGGLGVTMKRNAWKLALLAAVGISTGAALAAEKVDPGKVEYDTSCALCHGLSGKGDGPYKSSLTKAPVDLSQLAKKNGGVYPFD